MCVGDWSSDVCSSDLASDAARISASIGKRKKALMLEKASELGIKVLNKNN